MLSPVAGRSIDHALSRFSWSALRYSYDSVWSELCECNNHNSRPGSVVTNLFRDRCARANMGQRLVRQTALAWSRFSGVGYATLTHCRHCVER